MRAYIAVIAGSLLTLASVGCGDAETNDGTLPSEREADAKGGEENSMQASVEDFDLVDCNEVESSTEIEVGPGLRYVPADATVPRGEVVEWVWADEVDQEHNVVGGGDCSSPKSRWFKSDTFSEPGVTFCVRFEGEPGTYAYQCTIPGHCRGGMKGTVEVTK